MSEVQLLGVGIVVNKEAALNGIQVHLGAEARGTHEPPGDLAWEGVLAFSSSLSAEGTTDAPGVRATTRVLRLSGALAKVSVAGATKANRKTL